MSQGDRPGWRDGEAPAAFNTMRCARNPAQETRLLQARRSPGSRRGRHGAAGKGGDLGPQGSVAPHWAHSQLTSKVRGVRGLDAEVLSPWEDPEGLRAAVGEGKGATLKQRLVGSTEVKLSTEGSRRVPEGSASAACGGRDAW